MLQNMTWMWILVYMQCEKKNIKILFEFTFLKNIVQPLSRFPYKQETNTSRLYMQIFLDKARKN